MRYRPMKDVIFQSIEGGPIWEDEDGLNPKDEFKMLWQFACDLRHVQVELVNDNEREDHIGLWGHNHKKYLPFLDELLAQIKGIDEQVFDAMKLECFDYMYETQKGGSDE